MTWALFGLDNYYLTRIKQVEFVFLVTSAWTALTIFTLCDTGICSEFTSTSSSWELLSGHQSGRGNSNKRCYASDNHDLHMRLNEAFSAAVYDKRMLDIAAVAT
jgi:hypothetical protein